ncbi:diguanylate cyclase response regulator [Clostridium sp. chh4-2]|uniref:GGDEF domain-containing response regulator n=1 Tax=Clostridium sp. chh4-2 TaxID=2067550 RepID=UPI000CCF841B|nr:diguanylate cyclase [Clostridium sp. chh4-2]PNV62119.1 diguanylate cyclase response regulator [Clostridium sp. chh4-2]
MSEADKQTVLIVDDSIFICGQIKMILKDENLILAEAHSGEEAIMELKRCKPDLILLDVVLPDTEGYELCQMIKAQDQNHAAIIFITSKDSDEDVVKGFSMGACDYIKKPFGKEELRSRVMAHLKMKKQKDELDRMNKELQMNMEKLNYMAFRDGLTGLYNRRYVQDDLMDQIEDESRENVSNVIVMADVDNFKRVNDQYGHEAGDMVLVCISNIMESVCKRHKVIRWGGEEFLLVLFSVTEEEAFDISEKIRKQIEEFPFAHNGVGFRCTITMGLNSYDRSVSMEENIARTDKALYYGKRHQKNCSVWYEKRLEE